MTSARRVVSLLPSATEMVCAVGARGQLVGRSHECDFPADVASLPVLTRPRRELPRGSGAIDRTIREILQDALAVYEVDLEALRRAAPDVIVTQDLCSVCAVPMADVVQALRELARDDVEVVNLRPLVLQDVWDDVRRVGQALGRGPRGAEVASDLERRCAAIARRAAALPQRPSVLTVEWLDPVMVGGTWMPELVALAGGEALVTGPGQHAPVVSLLELQALDPDVVVVKPCGFDLARTREEARLLASNLPWNEWQAVRTGRVFVADGNAFFNRPGPRLVESLEILAACVHPAAFADLRARHLDDYCQLTPDLAFRRPGA